ncbi:MAG: P22 phage major capsid protein family protein [Beijerinckiaceae bacterium]
MPNTTLTLNLVARMSAKILEEESPFLANINKDLEDEYKQVRDYKPGQTVRIRIPPSGVVYEGNVFAGGGSAPDNTEKFVDATVLPQKHIGLTFGMREQALEVTDFKERILRPQMRVLASWVEADLMARAYPMIPNVVGTPGTVPTTMKTYALAREKLQSFLAMPGDRATVFSSACNTELVDTSRVLFNPSPTINKGFLEGTVGRAQGADFYEHQSIPLHTNGTQASWTVNGAGQVGSTLNIGGLTAAQTIRKGTSFTIAGVFAVHPLTGQPYAALQQFTVAADFTAAGTTGAITIFPEIQPSATIQNRTVSASPAAAAACTMYGAANTSYRQNMMFQKNAFAVGFVPLGVPKGLEGSTATLPNGISVRVYSFPDGTNDRESTRIDVMYAFAGVRPLHACRITE